MHKNESEQNFLVIDNNNKIKMVRSKLSKDSLKEIIQKAPLNRKTLLICLIAGLVTGALLAIFR